jgi:mannose-6-phosphate isomerase-like protein (cupin superfamily)
MSIVKSLLPLCLVSAVACASQGAQSPGTVITALNDPSSMAWTPEEEQREVSLRNLRRSNEASFHLLRIRGTQKSQMHRNSDVVLFVVKGSLSVKVGQDELALRQGDVLEIPRNTSYGLRNSGAQASSAYLVATPPLDASDTLAAEEKPSSESSWKYNLWNQ